MVADVDSLISGDAPGWFRRALHTPFFDEHVEVDGARIHYLAWGEPGRRGLVFVHGGAAHAHWWTHIAATFSREHRVVAIDLSGHGDSDHRDAYSLEQWAAEVVAVAADAGIDGPPVIIGHSMGGFVTIATAAIHPDAPAAVVVLDSPVVEVDDEVRAAQAKRAFGETKVYPSAEEALARFRTVPPQDHDLDYVIHHVARRSLHEVPGGWSWKFDHHVFSAFTAPIRARRLPYLSEVRCRFSCCAPSSALRTPDIGESMYGEARPGRRVAPRDRSPRHARPALSSPPPSARLKPTDHSTPQRR
ncbi:MAG: alpha/beta hydrolase [Acidimicrobiales bacterium]